MLTHALSTNVFQNTPPRRVAGAALPAAAGEAPSGGHRQVSTPWIGEAGPVPISIYLDRDWELYSRLARTLLRKITDAPAEIANSGFIDGPVHVDSRPMTHRTQGAPGPCLPFGHRRAGALRRGAFRIFSDSYMDVQELFRNASQMCQE